MAKKTKKELLDELRDLGVISDSNLAEFESRTVAELKAILIQTLDDTDDSEPDWNEESSRIAELEQALGESEAELMALKNQLNAPAPAAKPVTPTAGRAFSFRGKTYKFVDHAPKVIQWRGAPRTQNELIADESALLQLVGMKSSLIQKL